MFTFVWSAVVFKRVGAAKFIGALTASDGQLIDGELRPLPVWATSR